MAQVLSPDGTLQQGNWTGDHTALDESVPLDTDFAYSQDNPNGSIFELSLSNPAQTPGSGDVTVSYRFSQVDGGAVDTGGGTQTSLDVSLYQGATVIASDAQQAPGALFSTRNWVIPAATAASITDWADLRVVAMASGGGGSPSKRRGVALSWISVSVPDAPAGNPGNAGGALGASSNTTPLGGVGVGRAAVTAALAATLTVTAMGGAGSSTGTAAGSLAGVTVSAMAGSASGGATQTGNATGVFGEHVSLLPLAGGATGAATAIGGFVDVLSTSLSGGAAGASSASGALGAQFGVTPLSGASSGAGAANGSLPSLTAESMSGSAQGGSGGSPGNASGGFGLLSVVSLTGGAAGGAQATGAMLGMTITPMGGSANGSGNIYAGRDGLTDIRQRLALVESLLP